MSANIDHRAHAVAANGHGAFVFVSVLLLVFICVVFASVTKKLAEDERVNVVKSEFVKLQRASALFKEIYHCEAGSCPKSTLKRIFKDNIPKECGVDNAAGSTSVKFNKNCALLSLEEIGGVKLQKIKFKNQNLTSDEDYDILAVKSSFANDAWWFMSPNSSQFKKCKNTPTQSCDAVERYLDYLFNVENEAINENGDKIKMPQSRSKNESELLWYFATIDFKNGIIAPILSSDLSHKLDKTMDDGLPMTGHVVALEAASISEEHGGNYADGLKKISSCYDFKREEKGILELLMVDSSTEGADREDGLSDYLEGITLSVKCEEVIENTKRAKLEASNRKEADEEVGEEAEGEYEPEYEVQIKDKAEIYREAENEAKTKQDCINYRDFMKESGQDSVIRPKNEYSDYRDVKYHGCVMVFGA